MRWSKSYEITWGDKVGSGRHIVKAAHVTVAMNGVNRHPHLLAVDDFAMLVPIEEVEQQLHAPPYCKRFAFIARGDLEAIRCIRMTILRALQRPAMLFESCLVRMIHEQ